MKMVLVIGVNNRATRLLILIATPDTAWPLPVYVWFLICQAIVGPVSKEVEGERG